MGTYLAKLKNTITDTQARQITNLLIKQKQSGDIKNLEEFRQRLTDLTNKLLADHITPSLELFLAEANSVITSETFDFMIERIKDDLETAFTESNTLSEVLTAHKNIINNVLLNAIKLGIAELESKISTYEFLASDNNGFDNGQFNTFKSSQNGRTSRSSKDTNVLFIDPRTKGLLEEDVTLDLVAEDILLPLSTVSTIIPKSVRQIFNTTNTQSLDNVSFETSNINNIIDGSDGTFWVYSTLQKTLSPSISSKIEFNLGNYVDVNFINIEAAVIFPMNLNSIEYNDSNNQIQVLNINDVVFNSPKNFYFNKITTNKIFLNFSQSNALEIQYVNKAIVDNYDNAVAGIDTSIDVDSMSKQIRSLISSSKIVQNALLIPNIQDNSIPVRIYDYSIGFDNIRIGYSTFAQNGIFVSNPTNINALGQLAIKAKEKRPVELNGTISITDDTYPKIDTGQYFHGSIEYWAIVYNFESNDQLIDINYVPLLPVGVDKIYHEGLVLSNTINSNIPNVGVLMFYTKHFNNTDLTNIKVYRNGTLLTNNIDWAIETSLTNDVISPSGKPNSVAIRILHPTLTDFYTVTYSPLQSNTRAHPVDTINVDLQDSNSFIKIIDLVGDGSIRNGIDNILYISSKKNAGKITDHSNIYLSIILRRNSINENLSPSVEEYLLLSSSNNMDKFNG